MTTTTISCRCKSVKLKFPSSSPRAVTECCCNHCYARLAYLEQKGGPAIPLQPILTSKWDNCIQVVSGRNLLGAFQTISDSNVMNIYAKCCHSFLLGRNAIYDANCVTVVNECVVFENETQQDYNTATSRWFINQWDSSILSKFPPLIGIWMNEHDDKLVGDDGWEQVFCKMKANMEREIPENALHDDLYQTFDDLLRDSCGPVDIVYEERSMFPKWPFNVMMASGEDNATVHSNEDIHEMKPPAATVEEAVSKGLLNVDAVQSTYDEMAEEYLQMLKADESNEQAIGPTHAALKKLCNLISNLSADNGRVILVDVGCGPGTLLIWLAQQEELNCITPRPLLIGIDLSPAMIELAKKESLDTSSDIEFRVGNMLQLDFGDSSVAGMCNGCCIQHVDLDGVRTTLSEAARVLVPGGVFVLQFWMGKDAPMPGPEGAAFIGWELDTIRSAIQDTEELVLFDESQHVYQEFDMPYAFFYIRKT